MSTTSQSPALPKYDYDLLVIGCGPAGQRAAVQASKLKKRVAIVDKSDVVGGVCVNGGTLPTKSFREAVLFLSGYRQRHIYGAGYQVKSDIEMGDLTFRCDRLMQIEIEVIKNQLTRNNIEFIHGNARFADPHTLEIAVAEGEALRKSAEKILIAVGAHPVRPAKFHFDGKYVFDSENILKIPELPRSMVIVGSGVRGTEYGSVFSALGVHVTLVDKLKKPLSFLDHDLIESLHYQLRGAGITLRFGEEVVSCAANGGHVVVALKGGKEIVADCALVSVGRQSSTDGLGLEKLGIEATVRGKITVNEDQQTKVPHVYAAGDVTGFPALASAAALQGRRAAAHAFGDAAIGHDYPFPYGICSIPEISYVGMSEKEATQQEIPYEVGIARYREITRGHILGDENGLLKIVFNKETAKLLGVHIIGEQATELVHIGQAVLALDGDLNYLANAVFNYPTLAECYKVAALDGLNRLKRARVAGGKAGSE
jgi:NAD(P) transhydrogenase